MTRRERRSRETEIDLSLSLEPGTGSIDVPCGFLGHMLELLAHHGGWTLTVTARGDLQVDAHHLTEDLGITLGQALLEELRNGAGRARYGWCALPMDGTLVLVAADLSGRPHLGWDAPFPSPRCGDFDTELVEEFWRGFCREARITLHVRTLAVDNAHHLAEAVFKGVGRALRQALVPTEEPGSTKGIWL